MARAPSKTSRETLYYGSTRQQQYWENEAQTLRIERESSSSRWSAYYKQDGSYRPVPARGATPTPSSRKPSRRKSVVVPLTGSSAEEVTARLRQDHHLNVVLEQRLRRWMNKASGERVLAFLDPNQGGAPVINIPPSIAILTRGKE
jgi:hypothetical protein